MTDMTKTRVVAASNSTEAIALLNAAQNNAEKYAQDEKATQTLRDGLSDLSDEMRPLVAVLLENSRNATVSRDAKMATWKAYRAIISNVQNKLERYTFEEFNGFGPLECFAVIQYAESVYKAFPQFFPIPENEKRA